VLVTISTVSLGDPESGSDTLSTPLESLDGA
jgi:hypothetical protein